MNLKPPSPFCLIVDTREQHPLTFPDGVPVQTATCYPGDYSLVGHRRSFVIERKGATCNGGVWTSDLVGTITELLNGQSKSSKSRAKGSLRFRFELEAMSRIIRRGGIAFVAMDRPREWYAKHNYFGGLRPSSLFGMVRSLEADYGVPFVFFDSPSDLANEVFGLAVEVWKHSNGIQSFARLPKVTPPAPFAKWQRETGFVD